jgi:hypothetical protein
MERGEFSRARDESNGRSGEYTLVVLGVLSIVAPIVAYGIIMYVHMLIDANRSPDPGLQAQGNGVGFPQIAILTGVIVLAVTSLLISPVTWVLAVLALKKPGIRSDENYSRTRFGLHCGRIGTCLWGGILVLTILGFLIVSALMQRA